MYINIFRGSIQPNQCDAYTRDTSQQWQYGSMVWYGMEKFQWICNVHVHMTMRFWWTCSCACPFRRYCTFVHGNWHCTQRIWPTKRRLVAQTSRCWSIPWCSQWAHWAHALDAWLSIESISFRWARTHWTIPCWANNLESFFARMASRTFRRPTYRLFGYRENDFRS